MTVQKEKTFRTALMHIFSKKEHFNMAVGPYLTYISAFRNTSSVTMALNKIQLRCFGIGSLYSLKYD